MHLKSQAERIYVPPPIARAMETILSYLLSAQKKAKFIIYGAPNVAIGRLNTIGTYSELKSQLPQVYKQSEFPAQVVANGRQYLFVRTDKNISIFQTADVSSKRSTLVILFADEYGAFLAVGYNDSAVNFDYAQMTQQLRQEFEVRGGFQICNQNNNQELNLDDNNFAGARSIKLFGLDLKYIQKIYTKQKQQFTIVCFLDPVNPDFEFLIQQVACLRDRMPFLYFLIVLKDLVVYEMKSKKADPLGDALRQYRKISQRCKYISGLNIISDCPGLLDEALDQVPFVYQLFDLKDKRVKDELGCLSDQVEKDVEELIMQNEADQEQQYAEQKRRYLLDINFDKITDMNERNAILADMDRVGDERASVRRNYYYIHKQSELDKDILIGSGKMIFSGMEITLMRQPNKYLDEESIVLAFCQDSDVEMVCNDLADLDRTRYYILILIEGAWQLTVRNLMKRCPRLGDYCIIADEFGLWRKISETCGQQLGYVKFHGPRIQKVVSTVSELADSDAERSAVAQEEERRLAERLLEEQLTRIQRTFQTLDIDNDRLITFAEAAAQVAGDYPGANQAEATQCAHGLLALAKVAKDGYLQPDEFEDFAVLCGYGMK